MLQNLSIKGLAIVEQLSLTVAPGFNVITGETGAGKSILIKALNLLLGGKLSADAVRAGFSQAEISGVFQLYPDHPALNMASQLGIVCEQSTLIVRRIITQQGKSSAYLNDTVITNHSLKAFAPMLMDIYAQHETGRLLDPATHTVVLDQFLADKTCIDRYKAAHRDCSTKIEEIQSLISYVSTRAKDKDYLQFRLEDIGQFAPSQEEYQQLVETLGSLETKGQESDLLNRIQTSLDGDGSESPLACISAIIKNLHRAKIRPELTEALLECAQRAQEALNDLSFLLDQQLASTEYSPEELEKANARLGAYQDYMRKFSAKDIEELFVAISQLQGDLQAIEGIAEQLLTHISELTKATKTLIAQGDFLSSERQKAVKQISKSLEAELRDLAMPQARFVVQLSPTSQSLPDLNLKEIDPKLQQNWLGLVTQLESLGTNGRERARFLLSANPGEEPKPLDKVASGGELSRIMLAVKKALSAGADSCVLVFDEIDSGISGRVADIVGRKIQELSRSFQVICISHLPQVACYADAHFKVEKKLISKRTESLVYQLDKTQRIEEMARLLSGDKITTESMANASRFLEQAKDPLSKVETPSHVLSPAGHKPRAKKNSGMISPSL